MTDSIQIRRLRVGEHELACGMFRLMAEVFEETARPLSDEYVGRLLSRPEFWAVVALQNGMPVGGLTAHALPLTRCEATELFIYDIAVHPHHQRRGIGRALIGLLRTEAAREGITVTFVPADDEDHHALDFYRALGGAEAPVTIFTFE